VAVRSATVRANGLQFGVLEAGSGPLALCLHGFPDAAYTWRHLLPALAGAGFHAVAPFMRGYAPTAIPADGAYHLGALVADAVALHEVLGGDANAVLIGHDWGAEAAYGAAAFAPGRWRRLVTLAVPPAALDEVLFSDYEQLKRFFYLFMFRDPAGYAETAVGRDDLAFLDKLWRDWSPSYDGSVDLAHVKDALRAPENLRAAIGYYRAMFGGGVLGDSPPHPTLYLHGEDDGAFLADRVLEAKAHLSADSEVRVLPGVGHFLHLERPDEINRLVLDWLSA